MHVTQQAATYAASPVLPADLDVVKEITRPTLSAMKAFNGALAETCSNYQREYLQFLGRRWQENAALPTRLAACKSPAEWQGIWTEYWTRTYSQYSDEYQRLAHICQIEPTAAGAKGKKSTADMVEDGALGSEAFRH